MLNEIRKELNNLASFFLIGVIVAGLLALAGCAGLGFAGMSADQITAASKDKSSSSGCSSFTGAGGKAVAAFTNTDKGTLNSGGGTVTIECDGVKITFTDSGKAPAPKAAP